MNIVNTIAILVVGIVEIFLIYDFFNNFFDVKSNYDTKKIICLSIVVCAILFCVNFFENSYLNLFCVPLIIWSYVTLLFDVNIKKRFAYFILLYAILMSVEFLYAILAQLSAKNISDTGLVPLVDKLWQVIVVKILDYIFLNLVKQISNKSKQHISIKMFIVCMCLPLTTVGIMVTTFYSGLYFQQETIQKSVMTIFFVFMLIGSILVMYVFSEYSEKMRQNSEKQIIITKQKADLYHMKQTIKINEAHNRIIHDISNYMKTIGELAKINECGKIQNIVNQVNGEIDKSRVDYYCDNTVLNCLLSEKIEYAQKKEININVNINNNVKFDNIEDIDLISLVANLLDNAIRAASEKGTNTHVDFDIYSKNDNNINVFKVKNDYSNVKYINNTFKSTKDNKRRHGLGLINIKRICDKYGGCAEFYTENDKFISVIIIPS